MRLPATPFWLLRHGETPWNKTWRAMGQADVPLDETGEAQALAAARALAASGVRMVCHSPLQRTSRTAALIAAQLGVPLMPIPALIQCHWGDWQGQSRGDDGWHRAWLAGAYLPGVEPYASFHSRTLLGMAQALAQPGPVLVVAHGSTLTAIRRELGVAPGPIGHAVPVRFVPPSADRTEWSQHLLTVPA